MKSLEDGESAKIVIIQSGLKQITIELRLRN